MRSPHDANRTHCGGFICIRGRDDQFSHRGIAGERSGDGERPPHRRHCPVERQLADEDASADLFVVKEFRGVEDAEGDGEIKAGAFLFHVGRREVDGDAARRKPEAAVVKGGADPRVGFPYRGVGKSYQNEAGLL